MPVRKAGGDFTEKIAEAGPRKTAMRFMCGVAHLVRSSHCGVASLHSLAALRKRLQSV